MDNEIKTWLYDILQSINEIDSYYDGKSKIFQEYISDIKTKRAIERDLEIIGEAVNRIRKKDKYFKIENAEKIVGARNRIIHGYDKISDDLICPPSPSRKPNFRIFATVITPGGNVS